MSYNIRLNAGTRVRHSMVTAPIHRVVWTAPGVPPVFSKTNMTQTRDVFGVSMLLMRSLTQSRQQMFGVLSSWIDQYICEVIDMISSNISDPYSSSYFVIYRWQLCLRKYLQSGFHDQMEHFNINSDSILQYYHGGVPRLQISSPNIPTRNMPFLVIN